MRRSAPSTPRKTHLVALDPSWTPPLSARAAVEAAVEQLEANAEGVLASDDPEFVHQVRVALHRLRAALRAHRKALEPGVESALKPGIAWIAAQAGALRDLDVLAIETLPAMRRDGAPVAMALEARLRKRRLAARAQLRRALCSQGYAALLLDIACWLVHPVDDQRTQDFELTRFGRKAIRRQHRKVLRRAESFSRLDSHGRHRLRSSARRLRYIVEGFAPLLPREPVEDALAALGALQRDLGRANDATAGARVLASLHASPEHQRFGRRWLRVRSRAAIAAAERDLGRLAALGKFWKGRAP